MTLPCSHCQTNGVPTLEAVPLHGETIRTGFHIKASCAACGRYIKFVPQTPEVLHLIDEQNKAKKTLI